MLTLWKITGEASTDSGGGLEAYYVLTTSDATPPDPEAALAEAVSLYGLNDRRWYQIDRIERLGQVPRIFDADDVGIEAAMQALLRVGERAEVRWHEV